jgi:hypothetical protein
VQASGQHGPRLLYPQRPVKPTGMITVALLLTMSFGCAKKPEPGGYRVLSYDAATQQWVILRTGTFDGKRLTKRLTVVCSLYQWGDHEAVTGPAACHLQVGRMMIPNPLPPTGERNEFLDVDEQAYRYNNRNFTDAERFSMAVSGIVGKRVTFDQLTGKA